MWIYDFYLVYDKDLFEKAMEYGEMLLDESGWFAEKMLTLELDRELTEEELKEMKQMLNGMVKKTYAYLKNYVLVYEVVEI